MLRHFQSTTFPMSRDGLFGLIVGRLEFGYLYEGTNARVEYYINREPQNDWFDWLIKEHKNVSMNNDILLESIKSLFIRMDKLYQ